VIELARWVRCDPDIGGGQPPTQLVVVDAPGECHPRVDAQGSATCTEIAQAVAVAEEREPGIAPPEVVNIMCDRVEQPIDTVLRSHAADVADQVSATVA